MINKLFDWFESKIDPFIIQNDPFSDISSTRILKFIYPSKYIFLSFMILGLLNGIMDIGLFIFLGKLIDLFISSDPAIFFDENRPILITMVITILIVRPLLGLITSLVGDHAIQRNFSPLIRWQLHRHLMKHSVDFFHSDFAGNIASKVWQSGRSASEVVMSALQFIWSNVIFIISTLALLFWLDWRLSLIVMLWITLFILIAHYYVPITRSRAKASATVGNEFNGHLVDVYSNIQTVKLSSPKVTEEAYLKRSLNNFIIKSGLYLRVLTVNKLLMLFLSSSALAATGLIATILWSNNILTPGEVTLALGLMLRLDGQLNVLLNLVTGLFRSYGTFQASMDLANKPLAIQENEITPEIGSFSHQICFKDVHFGYGNENNVINGFSFTISPGEKVGLVGHSGVGKSTIASLLLRFYDVAGGSIEIDGIDIRDLKLDDIRNKIGFVTQDTALLHRTIKENISLCRSDATLEEIRNAARKAKALDFIEALKDSEGRTGFDAYVGERGLQLSGGQRQRISLARVFLKNPPILILDEATSALDTLLDNEIQQILKTVMDDKTVIAIAHRLSTIKNMDRIIFLHSGDVVESGTHDSLINSNGMYADLWSSQFTTE